MKPQKPFLSTLALAVFLAAGLAISSKTNPRSASRSSINESGRQRPHDDSQPSLSSRIGRAATASGTDGYPSILHELAGTPDTQLRAKLMNELLSRWMANDEAGLMAFIKGIQGPEAGKLLAMFGNAMIHESARVSDKLIYATAQIYAKEDLETATRWSGGFISLNRDIFPCIELFGRMTKVDPAKAMAIALTIPENPTRRFVMEHIAANSDFSNIDAAHAAARQLGAAEQAYFYSEYYRAMALENPLKACGAVRNIEDPANMAAAARNIGEAMAGQPDGDMNKALQWADSLPTPESRGEAVYAIYQKWSTRDPYQAVMDSSQRYPENPDVARGMFANAITGRNDEEIWQLAQELEGPVRPYAMLGSIGKFLETEPASEVINKVTCMPSGEEKDICSEFLASQPALQHDKAVDIASGINDAARRQQTLERLASSHPRR